MRHRPPHDLKLLEKRFAISVERLDEPHALSTSLPDLDVDFRFYRCPAPELVSGRTIHRKPMWQVPVSTGWAMRAAGR